MRNPWHLLATGFGSGLSPVVPGTMGSLAAIPFWYLMTFLPWQLYSLVVTRDETLRERLAPCHFNQPMVTGAPVVLTICADYRRTTLWAENRKGTPGYDNILSFMNAATDALLFTQTFTNLAEEAGLGTCFLGTTVYMPKMIIDTRAPLARMFHKPAA